MIVRSYASSRLLITQPDHAALAGRIMDRWLTRGLPDEPRRASVLRAVAEHDVGWSDVDESPLVDPGTGQVLDFVSAPAGIRQGVWPRAVDRLSDDPTTAALVAEHAIQVYSRYHAEPAWMDFFATMAARRDELAGRAGLANDALRRLYFFVRAGDLISLTFCTGWLEAQVIDSHEIKLIGPNDVGVHPDPFGGVPIPFEISGRALPTRAFSSSAEAREFFLRAPVVILKEYCSWPFVRGRASSRP